MTQSTSDKKTVLVTGATGFVGSHALRALSHTDVNLVAACRDETKLPEWFKGERRIGDLQNSDYQATLLSEIDIVVHAAAWTSMYGHARQEEEQFLAPTLALLERARTSAVSRFIFPSTHSAPAVGLGRNPHIPGIDPGYWPHMRAVVAIEDALRNAASDRFTAVNLRLGLFVGENYSLGLLPVLTERLKTRLVPWIDGGRPTLPLIDGVDIGQAIALAVQERSLSGFEAFNIVGPENPSMRELIDFLHEQFGSPLPLFGVPFSLAFPFAHLMRVLAPIMPWEPLIVPAIVHLLQDFDVTDEDAKLRLGYEPSIHWKASVAKQMNEMSTRSSGPMKLHKPFR